MSARQALPAAALLAVAIALIALAASGSFSSGSGRRSAARAPACLPQAPVKSAQIAGLPLYVSPAPGSVSANPDTQISFLGMPAARLHNIIVRGSESGLHEGTLMPYSQGDGGSFVLRRALVPGERVEVSASVEASQGSRAVRFAFSVDHPYSTADVGEFPNPPAPAADVQRFRTLPGVEAPVMSVSVPDHAPAAGDIFLTNGPGPGRYGPLIYAPDGRLIWFEQLPAGQTAENLAVQSYEGQRDLTFWKGKVLDLGFGEGEDVIMNDHYQVVKVVRAGNGLEADLHYFDLAGNGVAYVSTFNPIRCNLQAIGGSADGAILDNAIQEIDLRTGLVRYEWHALDHIPVRDSHTAPPSNGQPWDWLHVNSLDVQPSGNLFISARNTWAGYELQAGSGRILWELGGAQSSFRLGAGVQTAWQHDGQILPDGEVTFFDDGANPPVHSQSRAIRIALDFATMEARLSAVYDHPSPLLAVSQGNAQTLEDGGVVVEYGSIPQISEYAPNGTLLFDAHLPLDMTSYRGYRFPWSAQPTSPPAVSANENSTEEETIVHMSWNGATDVAAWEILAGQSKDALSRQETIPAGEAFEAATSLPRKFAYVAVSALSRSGSVLGSSETIPVAPYSAVYG